MTREYIFPFFFKLGAFIKKDFLIDVSYRVAFITRWIGIVISTVTFYYLSRLIGNNANDHLDFYGGDYFSFVVIGLGVISYLDAHVNGFIRTILREQRMGMFEVFLSLPTRLLTIVLSFSLYNTIMGFLAALCYFLFGGIFGVQFLIIDPIALCIIGILAGCIFLCLGIIAAACLIIFKRGDPITWVVTNLFWLFGGAYFPITVLPERFQTVCSYIPSTYVLRATRLVLLQGYSLLDVRSDIVVLFCFALALCGVSYGLLRMALHYGKKRGTIIFY